MFACTGQVTAGKLGVSVARSPAAVSRARFGIAARSAERRPGMERKMTWGMERGEVRGLRLVEIESRRLAWQRWGLRGCGGRARRECRRDNWHRRAL